MDVVENLKQKINQNVKILVVDDELKILTVLKRIFRSMPYHFEYLSDPIDALKLIENTDFAVIVSDNMMPGMSGLELLTNAKNIYPGCQRVLLTGATKSEAVIEAFNQHTIHRFVGKPFDNEDLLKNIQESIDIYCAEAMTQMHNYAKDKTIVQQKTIVKKTINELKQTLTQLELQKNQSNIGSINIPDEVKNLSFLVIEEHPAVRESIVATLSKAGVVHCATAENGTKAMEYLLRVNSMDVILCNWKLKDMVGLVLLKMLTESKLINPKPFFILMTTNQEKADIEKAIVARVDGYLIKPFKMETLVDQLNKILVRKGHQIEKTEQKKSRNNHFLVASSDVSICNKINNYLKSGGIERVSVTYSGQSAFHIIKKKPVDVLIYHELLSNPASNSIFEYSLKNEIDISNLNLIVVSTLEKNKEERLRFTNQIPTSFITTSYDDGDFISALNEFADCFQLSDFNIHKKRII